MTQEEIFQLMRELGAVLTDDHFVYTSGKHGNAYVNKDAIFPHTHEAYELGREIAERFKNDNIEVVVGPAIGGAILAQWVAYHLTELTGRDVPAVYAEKVIEPADALWYITYGLHLLLGDKVPVLGRPPKTCFVLKRGHDKLVFGKRALAVEDILNTGGSGKETVDIARHCGAIVVALAALCNRGGVTSEMLGVGRLEALTEVSLEAFEEDKCRLCAKGVPVNEQIGKGREFMERKRS